MFHSACRLEAKMSELRDKGCLPMQLSVVNVFLASSDGFVAIAAFFQLARIHLRGLQHRLTRQKVFHLLIGFSNTGYSIYFLVTLVAACEKWLCWSQSLGFVLMAWPRIFFLAAFLLLLSFWIDVCHQADDKDDEDEECSPQEEPFLEKNLHIHDLGIASQWRCCPLRVVHVRSRQRIVVLAVVLAFILMMVSAVLIGIETGKSRINSSVVVRVYIDILSVASLLLGMALARYGLRLFFRMQRIRSESATSEMRKVAGLSIVSVTCFTASAFVGFFTDVSLFYHWHQWEQIRASASAFLIIYSFLGSTIPSGFLLWVMRDFPAPVSANVQETRTIMIIHDSPLPEQYSRYWTSLTSTQNQVSRASPI